MKRIRVTFYLTIGLVALGGCRPGSQVETADLRKTFPSNASKSQDPHQAELLGLVNSAMEAEKKHEYAEAAGALMVLRTQRDLTVEQRSAVQDAMGNLQTSLAQRAAGGDAEAIKAMNAIKAMKAR